MNFLLYYLLRRFFVQLSFTDNALLLEKGLILRRKSVLPLGNIVRVSTERSLVHRILAAKKVTIYAVRGKLTFYLRGSETLPFLPEIRSPSIRPRFSELLSGAFFDTRALGGIALLAAFLRRLSSLFGGEYFDRVMSAISDTAETLTNTLSALHIAVPKIAAVLAVFILAAWALAFARKLLRLSRFRAARHGGLLRVQSGVITLYDDLLVLNSASPVTVSPLSAILAKRAPIYLRGVMIFPSAPSNKAPKITRALCNIPVDNAPQIKPPLSAFMGFCAAPLWWAAGLSGGLTLVYLSKWFRSAMLLKTVLYCGLIVSLYTVMVSLLCMLHSGLAAGERTVKLSMHRGLRLYTYTVPHRTIVEETFSQSIFQRRSGLCHFRLATSERLRLTARQLIKSEIPRYTPF
ncbi:MAG: PH domain-containing protein [Oscillospiraceae bacterium]|nr:PH domain-containing protein [Oscillospiraceae bacterium]